MTAQDEGEADVEGNDDEASEAEEEDDEDEGPSYRRRSTVSEPSSMKRGAPARGKSVADLRNDATNA